jgi:hypothetical protein
MAQKRGEQHYKVQNNWGGEEAFNRIKAIDLERRLGCERLGITLIEVRDLNKNTSIDEFVRIVREKCIANNITLPDFFDSVNLTGIEYSPVIPDRVRLFDNLTSAARERGFTLLDTVYSGSAKKHKFRCPNGHIAEITPNMFHLGVGCKLCKKKAHNTISVSVEGLGVFSSLRLAAAALGVNESTLSEALRGSNRCRGRNVSRLD